MKYIVKISLAIFLICILTNSSIISTSLVIKRNNRSTRRHRLTRANTKLERNLKRLKDAGSNTAFFICGALSKSGIPFISTIVGIFTEIALKAENLKHNSNGVSIEGKSYTCDMKGLTNIYEGTIEVVKARNKKNLLDAKRALEDCIANFEIDTTKGDKYTCKESKKHLTKLKTEGKALTKDKVLVMRKIKSFLADLPHYKNNLKRSIFNSKYECIKDLLKKMNLIYCRDKDGCENVLKTKLSEVYKHLETDNNEGLSMLYISDEMFGVLLQMDCSKITDMEDDDKVGFSTKLSAIWQSAGLIKACVEKETKDEPTWKKALMITAEIVFMIGDIALTLMCFGVLKIIRSVMRGCQALYALYQAKKAKENNDMDQYSMRMGEGAGYIINMVLGLVLRRHKLKK